MYALKRLLILVLAMSCTVSLAKGKMRDRKLSEYVLTYEEFNNLNLPERVGYMKFLIQFLSTVEGIQKPPADKTKTAQMMEQLFEMALSKAYAESKAGKTCINSFAVSEYEKNSSGKWICRRPTSTVQKCEADQTACGDLLYNIAKSVPGQKDLQGICVPVKDQNRTANCQTKFNELTGKYVDQAMAEYAGNLRKSSNAQKEFSAFLSKVRATIADFEKQSGSKGVSLAEYCKDNNAANGGRQSAECEAIKSTASKFTVATGLPVQVDTNKVEPAAATMNEAPVIPEEPIFGNDEPPVRQAPGPLPEPSQPKPQPPAPPTPTSLLGPLQCVAEGLAKAMGTKGDSYNNWVALMGVMVQRQSGSGYTPEGDPIAFQSKVIDAIGSMGYCSDKTYNVDLISNGKASDWIHGRANPRADDTSVANTFGINPLLASTLLDEMFVLNSNMGIGKRNQNLRKNAMAYARSYPDSGFTRCAGHLAGLDNQAFNFFCNEATKQFPATVPLYNNNLRNEIAASCKGIPRFKTPAPESCDPNECVTPDPIEVKPEPPLPSEPPAPVKQKSKKSGAKKKSPTPQPEVIVCPSVPLFWSCKGYYASIHKTVCYKFCSVTPSRRGNGGGDHEPKPPKTEEKETPRGDGSDGTI